jgi:hypothetical protein
MMLKISIVGCGKIAEGRQRLGQIRFTSESCP